MPIYGWQRNAAAAAAESSGQIKADGNIIGDILWVN